MKPLDGFSLLLLEDDPLLRRHLQASLERLGAEVAGADSLAAARRQLREASFDFAVLDVNLPDGLGIDLLRHKEIPDATSVIITTSEGGIRGAVESIQLGAVDYLPKPVEPEVLAMVFVRAREKQARRREAIHREETAPTLVFGAALAAQKPMLDRMLAADARVVAAGGVPSPVLVLGETGTGKTSLARWIHQNGPLKQGPLVEVNCSAIPESLAESELFGHEKGAFTDARKSRLGLFEAAHGGTLLLDELPSLSPSIQAKLLTVIESGKVRRVGANREVAIQVRLIAAAQEDLRGLAAKGKFREDLAHRLDLFRYTMPPLRHRGEERHTLAEHLIRQLSARHHVGRRTLSSAGLSRLHAYSWPGNIRELAHELERALVFEEGAEVDLTLLPVPAGHGLTSADRAASDSGAPDWMVPDYRFPESGFSMEGAIKRLIDKALEQSNGNVSGAARRLGVTRDYIRYRLNPGSPTGTEDR